MEIHYRGRLSESVIIPGACARAMICATSNLSVSLDQLVLGLTSLSRRQAWITVQVIDSRTSLGKLSSISRPFTHFTA